MPYKDPNDAAKAKHKSYLRNKETVRRNDKERLVRNQNFIKEYKSRPDVCCVECGMGRWECLDFHHPDPQEKFMAVGLLVKGRYSIAMIEAEIQKCVVLCANCHRIKHYGNIWNEDSNDVL